MSDPFRAKMKAEGLNDFFIEGWMKLYVDLAQGKTGSISEGELEPCEDLPLLDALPPAAAADEGLLGKTVMLKLNGGLGTGMGLDKAKSLLLVKEGNTFLDLIAKQVLYQRAKGRPVKFMLMNSFSTSEDTMKFLAKYPEIVSDPDVELMQHKAPKIDAATLEPAVDPQNPANEWCPPGHGDVFAAFAGSGKLQALRAKGYEYVFISNSDNLGATLDTRMLAHFARSGAPMCMEVCKRTPAHKKGGHLARTKAGALTLRESAQCSTEDEPAFQDITKHRYFNTNNLWFHLPSLQKVIDTHGTVPLPLIRNAKTVDPRDAASTKVFQLETAMGAAISSMDGAIAIEVPASRFAPVKTCEDLLVLRSDAYSLTEEMTPVATAVPVVTLDKRYKLVDDFEAMIPGGAPSLVACTKLVVKGNVAFAKGVKLTGEVEVVNEGAELKVLDRDLANESAQL